MRLGLVVLSIAACIATAERGATGEADSAFKPTNKPDNHAGESCIKVNLASDNSDLNTTLKCLEEKVSLELEDIVKYAPRSFRVGWLELERVMPPQRTDITRDGRNLFTSAIDDFTRTFVARLEVVPGIKVRISRGLNGKSLNYGLEVSESREEEVEEGRHRRRRKRKKVKNEDLLKILKLLFIPIVIQSFILPLVLFNINFIAVKALIAGKIAVLLTVFNIIRNSAVRSSQDKYTAEISAAHYGYNGGPELGSWFNGRTFRNDDIYVPNIYNYNSSR